MAASAPDGRWRRLVGGVSLLFGTTSAAELKRLRDAPPRPWMGAKDVEAIGHMRFVLLYGEDRIFESALGVDTLHWCLDYLDGAIAKQKAMASKRAAPHADDADDDSDDDFEGSSREESEEERSALDDIPQDDVAPAPRRWARNAKPKELTEADPKLKRPVQKGTPWTVELLRKLYLDMQDWCTRRVPPSQRMSVQDYHSNIRPAQHRAFYNPMPDAKQYLDQDKYWFVGALGTFPDQGSVLKASGLPHWHKGGFESRYWFSNFWKYLSNDNVVDGVPSRQLLPVIKVANGYAIADINVLSAGIDGWATRRKFTSAMRILYEYMEFHVLGRIREQGKGWSSILDDERFVAHLRAVPEPPEPPEPPPRSAAAGNKRKAES